MQQKIIFDVNIWISIFLGNKSTFYLDLIYKHDLAIIADDTLRNELLEVMSRKKFSPKFTAEYLVDSIHFFDSLCVFFATVKKFIGSPDIDDDYLFDLAIQSETNILVTGDKKLL